MAVAPLIKLLALTGGSSAPQGTPGHICKHACCHGVWGGAAGPQGVEARAATAPPAERMVHAGAFLVLLRARDRLQGDGRAVCTGGLFLRE